MLNKPGFYLILAVVFFFLYLVSSIKLRHARRYYKEEHCKCQDVSNEKHTLEATLKEKEEALRSINQQLQALTPDADFARKWSDAPSMSLEIQKLKSHINFMEKVSPALNLKSYLSDEDVFDDLGISTANLRLAYSDKQFAVGLANARDQVRLLIENGSAVRTTDSSIPLVPGAAACLLDAFNGYADRYIRAAVHKSDGVYGEQKQKIERAFFFTNIRGKSALHATISQEYLSAKLDILRWTVAMAEYRRLVHENQRIEREEQRRQEELRRKAQLAADEETRFARALEQARRELSASLSDSERRRLMDQIEDLQQKLLGAQEAKQRAVSMAQQTKRGTVYVLSNIGSFGENVYKIGSTRRLDPMERVNELNSASVPFPFDVHALIETEDAPSLEFDMHRHFRANKINKAAQSGKEFFQTDLADICRYVESKGIRTAWTTQPEAEQFRKSRFIRKSAVAEEIASVNDNSDIVPESSAAAESPVTASVSDSVIISSEPDPAPQKPDPAPPESAPSDNSDDSSEPYSFTLRYLKEHALEYVDKTENGGGLYFFDESAADHMKAHGISVSFAAGGTRSTRHRPAWFVRAPRA